jgi:hypothetical protein
VSTNLLGDINHPQGGAIPIGIEIEIVIEIDNWQLSDFDFDADPEFLRFENKNALNPLILS